LDLTALHKKGFIRRGQNGESTSKCNGRTLWAFSWCFSDNSVIASYNISGGAHAGHYQHPLDIINQAANFGSDRLYLKCPQCASMRKKIYFCNGVAACRICHNLHYKSQSESSSERKYRKLDRLLSKVNNFGSRFDGYGKPKGQHWQTYQALDATLIQLEQSIYQDIDSRFGIGQAQRHFG
jgi:hypothetical protein